MDPCPKPFQPTQVWLGRGIIEGVCHLVFDVQLDTCRDSQKHTGPRYAAQSCSGLVFIATPRHTHDGYPSASVAAFSALCPVVVSGIAANHEL